MGQNNILRANGVSVIICCYNSANNIFKVLHHIELQKDITFPLEVIVVNNNSSDETETVVKRFIKETNLDIKLIFESNPGLMHARESGLRESRYEFIQFCDDDNLLSDNYIHTLYEFLNNDSSIGACGGKGIALIENNEPIWFKKYSRAYAVGSQLKHPQDSLYGAGISIRYSALEKIYMKGFKSFLTGRTGNVLLAGDDGELVLALMLSGYKLKASDDIYFHHIIPEGRLSKDYLMQLHEGFGMMYPVIDIYRKILSKKFSNNVIYYNLLHFRKIVKAFLSFLFKAGIDRKVQFSLLKGNIKGFFYFLNKKREILKVIHKIIS
ncbi:MAG: glycosyltransferase [Bacteroidota bacterium]|nr:glycosyltransferase [Bacteroidota bacterium]